MLSNNRSARLKAYAFAAAVFSVGAAGAASAHHGPRDAGPCSSASLATPSGAAVCLDPRLSSLHATLDARLAALRGQIGETAYGAFDDEQTLWRGRRDACLGQAACLEAAYRERIAQVDALLRREIEGRARVSRETRRIYSATTTTRRLWSARNGDPIGGGAVATLLHGANLDASGRSAATLAARCGGGAVAELMFATMQPPANVARDFIHIDVDGATMLLPIEPVAAGDARRRLLLNGRGVALVVAFDHPLWRSLSEGGRLRYGLASGGRAVDVDLTGSARSIARFRRLCGASASMVSATTPPPRVVDPLATGAYETSRIPKAR